MKRYITQVQAILYVLIFACPSTQAASAIFPEKETRPAANLAELPGISGAGKFDAEMKKVSFLSPRAWDVAELLGVTGLIERLIVLQDHDRRINGRVMSIECLSFRQELTEVILTTMLQVHDVIAKIDMEISAYNQLQNMLEDKRDRAISYNSWANIVGAGALNTGGAAGELVPSSEVPGEIAQVVGGGINMILGALALRQQNGSRQMTSGRPNMLAQIFNRQTDSQTEYPPIIWKYLNKVPAGSGLPETRREYVVSQWVSLHAIDNPNTQKGKMQIQCLTSTMPKQNAVTIGLLEDRMDLLADVRAQVSQLDSDLLELMTAIRSL